MDVGVLGRGPQVRLPGVVVAAHDGRLGEVVDDDGQVRTGARQRRHVPQVQGVDGHDLVDEAALLEDLEPVDDGRADQPVRVGLLVVEMADALELRIGQVALVEDARRRAWSSRGTQPTTAPIHSCAAAWREHRVGVLERVGRLHQDGALDAGRTQLGLQLGGREGAVDGPVVRHQPGVRDLLEVPEVLVAIDDHARHPIRPLPAADDAGGRHGSRSRALESSG